MNCKQGDMAVTFGAPMDNGLVVEVLHALPFHRTHGPCWMVRSLGSPFHWNPNEPRHTVGWPDAMLKPIRPQPDDAVDQFARTRETTLDAVGPVLHGVEAA